jgi:hypothetical protein
VAKYVITFTGILDEKKIGTDSVSDLYPCPHSMDAWIRIGIRIPNADLVGLKRFNIKGHSVPSQPHSEKIGRHRLRLR